MKKVFISAVIAIASLTAFNASAQNNSNSQAQPQKKECCAKQGKKCDKKQQANLFEGIQLSADQQTRLNALQEKRMAAKAEKMKAAKEAKAKKAEARKAAKKEYFAEVKEILTPDQYVVFLENIAVNQPMHKDGKGMKPGKRDHKKGMQGKGQKVQRGQRPSQAQN